MNTQTSVTGKRLADASAIGVIAATAMPWLQISGFVGLFISNISGFDLITGLSFGGSNSVAYPAVALTPLAGLLCLFILIYSEVNPASYNQNRKSLAIVRIVAAIAGAVPPLYLLSEMSKISPTDMIAVSASVMSSGPGVYAALIALLVVAGEAVIDIGAPTQA